MKKRLFILCLLCLCAFSLQAQGQRWVKLRNGGRVLGMVSSSQEKVEVRTLEGETKKFDWQEIDKIGKPLNRYKSRPGYINMSSVVLHTGRYTNNWGGRELIVTPSIHTFNGYQWEKGWALGITTGIDGYPEMEVIPVALGGRGELFESNYTLMYGLDLGYGFPRQRNHGCIEYTGGLMLNPMLGVKRYGKRGRGMFLQLGWRLQYMSSQSLECWWGGIEQSRDWSYRRLQMGLGLFF